MTLPLQIFVYVIVFFLSYFLMRELTGVHISEFINRAIYGTFGFLQKESKTQAIHSIREFGRMSAAQKSKSVRWKYYSFLEDLLTSLRIKQLGMSVEGLTIVSAIVSLGVAIATQALMPGIFMFIIVTLIVYISILALLYLISRMGAQERKKDTLNTIDLLCSVMQDGVLVAIESSMSLIPKSLKPSFTKFIRNVNNLNYSVETAITILNKDVGPAFDEFCETVIIFERDRAPGMEMLFSFIVEDNAKESLRDVKIRRTADAVNMDFVATCGLMVLMLMYTIFAYPYVANVYASDFGHFLIMMYILSALITFIVTQYIMGQAYIYKEK